MSLCQRHSQLKLQDFSTSCMAAIGNDPPQGTHVVNRGGCWWSRPAKLRALSTRLWPICGALSAKLCTLHLPQPPSFFHILLTFTIRLGTGLLSPSPGTQGCLTHGKLLLSRIPGKYEDQDLDSL
jgi:hypothetical protein